MVSDTEIPESVPAFAWWLSMGMALSITVSQKDGISSGMRRGEDRVFLQSQHFNPFVKEPDTFVLQSVASESHCVVLLGLTFFLGKGSDIHLWNSTIKRATVNTEWIRGS